MIGCGFVASVPWIRNADNNQVVNLGDSIFALSGEIQGFLHDYAGETFRRYSVSGAELTGGILAPSVYSQYNTARGDNPNIDIIFMDAGGNDILLPAMAFDPYDCKTQWYEWGRLSSSCKSFIDDLYVDAVNLLNDMYADGVDHVIYQGYYYTKNALFLLDDLEEAIDYGDMRLAQACQNSAVDCTFIDPRSTIKDSDIISDGIHPATSGSLKLANLMWPVLAPLLQ
ncbi:MAG: SGNH/GDSL hydrolase family protein [Deltaproteobacteria bacterium]|nr:SGNH/GDSL hydrolase family protein [Deltaproteobacteria bacterium]